MQLPKQRWLCNETGEHLNASDEATAAEKLIKAQLDGAGQKLLMELNDLQCRVEACAIDWAYQAGLEDGLKLNKSKEAKYEKKDFTRS